MPYFLMGVTAAVVTALLAAALYQNRLSRFGGLAVLAGFSLVLWLVALKTPYLLDSSIKHKHLFGLSLAAIIVYAGAYLAHRRQSRGVPLFLASVILAALIIVASGIGVRIITNPWGGVIPLDKWESVLFWLQGIPYRITLPADLVTLVWLMIVLYSMRRINTLDGLVSSITILGALTIFFLTTATRYLQPEVATLAIITAGTFIGMLFWNWPPAKIRLGAGGSAFAGALLGILAIISGGKIATTLLVLGVPIFDGAWGLVRRTVWPADGSHIARKQLPYRLLDAGFAPRSAIVFILAISATFGTIALFLQSAQKLAALTLFGLLMVFLILVGSVAEPVADTTSGIRRRRLILGVAVDSLRRDDATTHLEELLRKGGQHMITTPNPEIIMQAQNDSAFRDLLNRAALALPDGFGLMLAARLLKMPLATRIPGSDFIFELAHLSETRGYTIYLLGGRNHIAQRTSQQLISRFRNLEIVGAGGETNIEHINSLRPDILLVALGHGKQEKWITKHLPELPSVKVAMGVGGAFDFIAGRVRRAPRLLRLLGLEWLWRLARQPWRLPRIYRAVIKFPFLVLREKYGSTPQNIGHTA